ncbi:hypothetical protein EZS27_011322 [termite gut metagenome]|uniref:Uncharacterized protein n=1 Tax=termite gut metagenome TaxID=433724 RepID=A0A5J4S4V4_9ZZZZ
MNFDYRGKLFFTPCKEHLTLYAYGPCVVQHHAILQNKKNM